MVEVTTAFPAGRCDISLFAIIGLHRGAAVVTGEVSALRERGPQGLEPCRCSLTRNYREIICLSVPVEEPSGA